MSESNAMLEQVIDRLFSDLAGKGARHSTTSAAVKPHWRTIVDMGLPDLLVPETSGGFGGRWSDAAFAFRALGRHGLALPVGETMLARRWLHDAGIAAPEGIGTFAFASDLNAVPWGAVADWILVVSASDWRLLTANQLSIEPGCNLAGDPLDHVRITDALPLASGMLDRGGEALFAEAALLRASQISGAIATMLALSIDHANQRVQFGKPIGRFQAIQQQLALLAGESAATACASASAAQAAGASDALFEIAAAKWRANRAAGMAADIACQVHGAIGITREFPLRAFTLRAQAWAADYGNERYWANWLGRFAAAERGRPLWHRLIERSDRLLDTSTEISR